MGSSSGTSQKMTDNRDYPFDIVPVPRAEYEEDPETKSSWHLFNMLQDGIERYGPHRFVTRVGKRDLVKQIYNMKVSENDVWVVTYPRSGTTWTQEMVWNIVNNLDFEKSKTLDIDDKFFFLDHDFMGKDSNDFIGKAISAYGKQRLIKTHLPIGLCPPDMLKKCKVVYVARNPKDVVISYYHHHRMTRKTEASIKFEEFLPYFLKGLLEEDPYLAHVKEGITLSKETPNICFLWYEDMKKDLGGAVKKVSQFLGVDLDEKQVESLANHLDFKNMKKNPSVNHQDRHDKGRFLEGESFIRKGEAGAWSEKLSGEMNDRFDRWLEENTRDQRIDFKWN